MTAEQAAAQFELGKLLHDLDMRCAARMRDQVSKIDLTVAQASALREMTRPMTLSELAGEMSCEPSNAIVVIDKLEKLRLVERRPHPSDRRAKQLVLTSEGTALREKLLEVLNETPIFDGLTQEEQDALQELLLRALSRR